MTAYEWLSLRSFVRSGYQVSVYTYGEDLELPPGTTRRDAREILEEEWLTTTREAGKPFAYLADLFRYRLLQLVETTWIDADMYSLGPPLPGSDEYILGFESPGVVNIGILKAPRESEFLNYAREKTERLLYQEGVEWGDTGPRLASAAVHRFHLIGSVAQPETYYPVHFADVWKLFDPGSLGDVDESCSQATTIHLWSEILKRGGPLKHVKPPFGSWLHRAFERDDVGFWADGELDAGWVKQQLCWETNDRDRTLQKYSELLVRLEATQLQLDATRLERDELLLDKAGLQDELGCQLVRGDESLRELAAVRAELERTMAKLQGTVSWKARRMLGQSRR